MITLPYNFKFHEFLYLAQIVSLLLWRYFSQVFELISISSNNLTLLLITYTNYRLKHIHFKQNLVAKSWKFIWILKMTKIKRKQRRRNLKVCPSNRWSTYFFVLACQVASNWHQSMKFPSMRIWDFLPKMAKKYFLLLITDVLVSTCIM